MFLFLCLFSLLLLGVQLFPESDTQFLTETVKALDVLLVLVLVLNLGLDTCSRGELLVDGRESILNVMRRTFKDANSGREVVDAARSLQGSSENLNGGHEVVGEAVVQVTLL